MYVLLTHRIRSSPRLSREPALTDLLLLCATTSTPAGHRLLGATAGTRIGARSLTARRQIAAMPQTAIGADFDQALDVQRHLAPQIAFDLVLLLDQIAQHADFSLG